MHKAIGWMLREVGKRNKNTLTEFLENHVQQMPRISMLRYTRLKKCGRGTQVLAQCIIAESMYIV
ncbi:MAG: DNA alkylation repair protein [Pirellulaceae bacterium]